MLYLHLTPLRCGGTVGLLGQVITNGACARFPSRHIPLSYLVLDPNVVMLLAERRGGMARGFLKNAIPKIEIWKAHQNRNLEGHPK